MTDIFFSYRSADREHVRPVRDAFASLGFDVFWDQEVPAGVDWDTWIRRHLTQSKCALVFWSRTSATSDNVRHEATVAKQQNKLIPVLLEPLAADEFPMGLYAQQAANLVDWDGDLQSAEWRKLRNYVEVKLTPNWVRDRIDELEAELAAERARREAAERRDRIWQAQIAKEVEAQQDLRGERDKALDEVTALLARVQELSRELPEVKEKRKGPSPRVVEAENQGRAAARQLGGGIEAERESQNTDASKMAPVRSREKTAAIITVVAIGASVALTTLLLILTQR